MAYAGLAVVSNRFPPPKGRFLRITHPFATLMAPEGAFSFNLHVLGLPPAFVLSQDQTLKLTWVVNGKNQLLPRHISSCLIL